MSAQTGKVYLVGAGPGDPGLITQKGIERLSQADVIVYDHLLDERLLASYQAEKIYVGKSGAQHAREQDEINQVLVEKAKAGKTVVRLKGGDPFVFGRGGEEALELVAAGIPFEVVPGVTSAIAVPAYAGIPVTHRGIASSFAVITGHEDPGEAETSINWAKVSTGIDTLLFLMGLQNLGFIVRNLTENGRPPETPAAVIKDGTKGTQQVVTGTLADIVRKAREQGLTSPAVIVVGEVVKLREKLRWFDNRPLSGKRVLVTRARHQASVLSALLAERGATLIELPAITIRPIPDNALLRKAITELSHYNWILFTSVNAVELFFSALYYVKIDARALCGLKIGAIGSATAQALEQKGIIPDYQPEIFTTAALAEGLKRFEIAGKSILLPRAEIADEDLVRGLEQMGAKVTEVPTYETMPATEDMARARELILVGETDVVTFTSSSTVANLVSALGGDLEELKNVTIAAIGPKTAETARKAGLKVEILATEQTIPGLVRAIEEHFTKGA